MNPSGNRALALLGLKAWMLSPEAGFRFDTTMQGPGLGLEYRF